MSFPPIGLLVNLHHRADLLKAVRAFFDRHGMVEVQTPVLSADTIVDHYVEPFALTDASLPINHHGNRTYYLQTSPEFSMKRLLAAGMENIYQIGPVFRKGDLGKNHNVEFTMLEWYRTGADYPAGMEFLDRFIRQVVSALSFITPSRRQVLVPLLAAPIPRKTYRDLFQEHLQLDPHRTTPEQIRNIAESLEIRYPESYRESDQEETTDAWLDLLFSERIQPNLESVIVHDYPLSQAQLSRTGTVRDATGPINIGERFELFLCGTEIANGYHELLNANTLRTRFRDTNKLRKQGGLLELPLDSRLLAAMESGLPPSSGTALGIDRLLMFLLEAESIDQVQAFTIEKA